jgi:hypothetical protein
MVSRDKYTEQSEKRRIGSNTQEDLPNRSQEFVCLCVKCREQGTIKEIR